MMIYRALQRHLFISFLFFFSWGCQTVTESAHSHENESDSTSFILKPMIALIRHHREYSTHIDGPSCPMYPSCAAYGEKAIRQEGILGLLLLADRLFYRETGNLMEKYVIAPGYLSKEKRYYDPLTDSTPGGPEASLLKEEFR